MEAGDYYAAVVIDRQFTRNMYRMLTDWTGKPAITYYENAKKNAVAAKITDTAVETLKRSISENYLEVVISSIMEQSNLLAADLNTEDPDAAVKGVLYQAQDLLHAGLHMMDAFQKAGNGGVSPSNAAAVEDAIAAINRHLPDGDTLHKTAAEIQLELNAALARAERALEKLQDAIENAPAPGSSREELLKAADRMESAAASLEQWAADLERIGTDITMAQAEDARQTAARCRELVGQLRALAEAPDAEDILNDCDRLITDIRGMVDRIPVTAAALQKQLSVVSGQVADTMEGVAALNADAKALKTALKQTGDAAGAAMGLLRPAVEKLLSSLEETLESLQEYTDEQFRGTLLEILGGDPLVYGQYFPEMVQTRIHTVYPVANYGSAMTPFYTVLSIWVGGVILSSIVKVHARTEGLIDPKPAELFFGRYLFFFVISQIQSIVIVSGGSVPAQGAVPAPRHDVPHRRTDGLHLQPAHLFAGHLLRGCRQGAGGGHHGHADRRVVRHLPHRAAAGNLPKNLPVLPLPYAIDAMRECICGMYGSYYWQQVGFLLLFAAAALVIGLLVRRPFMGLGHFMEEKLEETELL